MNKIPAISGHFTRCGGEPQRTLPLNTITATGWTLDRVNILFTVSNVFAPILTLLSAARAIPDLFIIAVQTWNGFEESPRP